MLSPEELRTRLTEFTGTAQWYEDSSLPGLRFTDGVKFFLEETGAVQVLWVAHQQGLALQEHEDFLALHFVRDAQGAECRITDGNYHPLGTQRTAPERLPEGDWEFWLERGVLYLPSEH